MKAVRSAILIIAVLLVLIIGADYLAMNMVQRDYISQTAMAEANLLVEGKNLPDWTNASLVWKYLLASTIAKLALVIVLVLIVVIKMWSMQRNITRLSTPPPPPADTAPPVS